ncbi:hypothetical protein ACFV2A_01405 [Streptomyces californicus]|uniref:hypothetical protein n=1 Tax=Streptomyces californicus TaxID=67351 RepID=UPI0033AD6142
MAQELEKPNIPAEMYHALGDDVAPARPTLTGDIFENVAVANTDGTFTTRAVMILDHPCSLRPDGLNLAPRLLAAEVQPTPKGSWKGNYNKMFLPAPFPGVGGEEGHCAAFFDVSFHVAPEQLDAGTRIACLSPLGINLMLQRRVKHFSRVTVKTFDFMEANVGVYEEADLLEDWCMFREDDGIKTLDAVAECISWLREGSPGSRRQDLLKDPQQRSTVRQQMRAHLREQRELSRTSR